MPDRPWRKVILDINNSPDVEGVGAGFDPEEFAATLKNAHVNALVTIAKDTNGYCYFPSERGPHLPAAGSRDLLPQQVDACRAAGL